MFKKAICMAVLATASAQTVAAEPVEEKHFSLGIASFATIISVEIPYYGTERDDFSGFGLFGTGAVNDNLGFRLSYAKQSLDDNSDLKLDVVEGSLLAGTGLATTGFKAYGSFGFYSETLKANGASEELDFSGAMFGGGVGYNWNPVSLEFWINFRSTSDYEDLSGGADVTAASGGLGLSARF
ncbi:outer membrane beta-barrel protein [Marinobacter sp. S6332]|uniref:outer membrane beta-barrel protein n=1 Tax=Marinobacter sp. S6332 TaxID=2926403 RepID=UPI001FF22E25|nr:outer membrane beta-barrel protein [Marinobacter sp. S6332]MCK0164919.1 porin family protein [Marinobacter sp. S6332]